MIHRLSWNKYFMALAKLAAMRSGCNSRPTGAVIVVNNRVIATGYNGSLPGQPQCTDSGEKFCLRRALKVDDTGNNKYQECPSLHAEQNALNQLALGGGLHNQVGHLYCTLQPCIFCLKNIKSVGITTVYYELNYMSDDPVRDQVWKDRMDEYSLHHEKVYLSDDEVKHIIENMYALTSRRRF